MRRVSAVSAGCFGTLRNGARAASHASCRAQKDTPARGLVACVQTTSVAPPGVAWFPMKPVVLIVLDGLGHRDPAPDNAVSRAQMPTWQTLLAQYPSTLLQCSGLSVGLPDGQMGNSEVGHTILGGGRVVYQDLVRINQAIADGSFFDNPELLAAIDSAKRTGATLHLFGLTSPGGIHSTLEHGYALCELARRAGLSSVAWHAFLDGRDTPPQSALDYVREVQDQLAQIGVGEIASLCGRFYAMDRDQRWDRVAAAYRMLTCGQGQTATDAQTALRSAYDRGETDEFVKPIVLTKNAKPIATVQDGDSVVFWNYRADRARELCQAFTDVSFSAFDRGCRPKLGRFVCMTQYAAALDLPVAFAPESLHNNLGEYLAGLGLSQFRTAETEKYAHVTFFFNGGREAPYPKEERRLVPSLRDVQTYDLAPAMSAVAVTDGVIEALQSGQFGFVLVNFANPDMVGHTGVLSAAINAVQTIDGCLHRICETAQRHGATVVITADHGNCEQMLDPQTGQPHTAHTTNPVPFVVVDVSLQGEKLRPGGLADVAPTVLDLMGLPIPAEMTGKTLVCKKEGA